MERMLYRLLGCNRCCRSSTIDLHLYWGRHRSCGGGGGGGGGGLLRLGDLDGIEVSDELLVTDLVTEGHPRKAVGSGVLTSGVATGRSGAGVATGRSGAWVATGRSGAGVATGRSGAGFVTSPLSSNKKKKKTGNYPSLYKRTSEHHYICSDSCGITMATAAMMN